MFNAVKIMPCLLLFYVTTKFHDFQNQHNKNERLKRKILSASRKQIKTWNERHQVEAYLGISPFEYELR
jgi:hypothetical protein